MPTEYWLQKKAFNSWSHVTWYDSEAEAKANFDKVAVEGNGYSWRMVKVEVVEERLLHDESPVLPPEPDKYKDAVKKIWTTPERETTWGKAPASWGDHAGMTIKSDHGMIGKVWLGNPTTKEKKRVEPSMVAAMMADGWIKAGPRTVL